MRNVALSGIRWVAWKSKSSSSPVASWYFSRSKRASYQSMLACSNESAREESAGVRFCRSCRGSRGLKLKLLERSKLYEVVIFSYQRGSPTARSREKGLKRFCEKLRSGAVRRTSPL